ncbi:4-hydroxy-tetrahydrodipicolinate synthase [Oceanobacillus bengalensis]|uniref:4-hydroxy-tetrahydrodipicolinate synthase n=1 Tax=Oceanobacillus bengalensis TaxID=1435466 RepID=A0A494Z4S6_9BACI|nr:4-hydroxy-tetrahydrodipicolinate synthase [Oceanobacillus bengalensis]RKQ17320.1 4-hydroxy-tetrahydrodipicolinate synthase [Oceanobacillus bengalensis]
MYFGQVLTAMVTPFDEKGAIQYEKTSDLIEYLLANGTDGLVVTGTTGESPTLSTDEKVDFIKHIVQVVNNRVPVIAGTGSYGTDASISLTKQVEKIGVDGFLIVTPYYNKPNQHGMFEHFKSIAASTELPIMLYNIPGRSIVNLEVETIVALSKIKNIVSLKEAGLDLDHVAEIIENTADDFSVYSGNDSLTIPMLSVGATGVVSVASHIIGNEMKNMIRLFLDGKVNDAAQLHRKMLPVMNGLFTSPSPSPVKAALQLNGIDVGGVRLPLVDLTKAEREKLHVLLKNID